MRPRNESTKERIHPLFPTLEETKANGEIVYSDHLPVLGHVPVTNEENAPALVLLSLNTLGISEISGLHAGRDRENQEAGRRRYQRIVAGLAQSVEQHDVDSVLLQETTVAIMLPLLSAQFGETWAFDSDEVGMITGYNTQTLRSRGGAQFDSNHRVLSRAFTHIATGRRIEVHNSWGIYEPFSHHREEEYRPLLCPEKNSNCTQIVMGDTNSRIAPLDKNRRNIMTGAKPTLFLKDKSQQEGDFPDGGFYCGSEGRIHRIEIEVIDLENGNIMPTITEQDLPGGGDFNMVMCLDASYEEMPIINGQTIFEYQAFLREQEQDPAILVRMASTEMNHQGIGIRFSPRSPLCAKIVEKLGEDCVIRNKDANSVQEEKKEEMLPQEKAKFQGEILQSNLEAREFPTFFAPGERIEEFVEVINQSLMDLGCYKQTALRKIDQEITRLDGQCGFSLIKRDAGLKKSTMVLLHESINNLQENSSQQDILDTYNEWANQLNNEQSEKTNAEIMAFPRNRFKAFWGIQGQTHSVEFLERTFPTLG